MRKFISILLTVALGLSLGMIALPMAGPVEASPAEIHVYDGDSIQDAINSAAPGDTIIVHPGTYTGNFTINKSLTINSTDGADNTTIEGTVSIDLEDYEVVVFGGTGAGFTVTGAGRGIDTDDVEYWSSLSIVGNKFIDNGGHGIHIDSVRYFSQVDIRSNFFTENTVGIYINSDVEYNSSLAIVDNQITDNDSDGMQIDDIFNNSQGLIQGNIVTGSSADGIYVDDVEHGSSLDVLDNQVTGNADDGIHIYEYEEGCEGLIRGNTVTGNGGDGIYIQGDVDEGSRLTLQDNIITGNDGYGFHVDDVEYGGYIAILDNQITDNTDDGIYVYTCDDGAEGIIQGNTVTGNGEYGIRLRSGVEYGGYLIITSNTISGTQLETITGEDVGTGDGSDRDFWLDEEPVVPGSETIYLDGTPTTAYIIVYSTGLVVFDTAPLNGVAITADYEGGGLGIFIDDGVENGSYLAIQDNQITGNAHDGIYIDEIDEGSEVIIGGQGNTITGNGGCGIEVGYKYYDVWAEEWEYTGVEEGAYLAILDNEIADNDYDGIYISEIEKGSEVLIQGNNAISGNDYGIYVEYMTEAGKLDIIENLITGNDAGGIHVDDTEEGSEVNVLGNTITGNTGIGLCLGGIVPPTLTDSQATIQGNTISYNTNWGIYLHVAHSVVDVSGNDILNNGSDDADGTLFQGIPLGFGGIYIHGTQLYLVAINQNNIVGNTEYGLLHNNGEMVDATNNWWGDASGPYDPIGSVEVPPCTDNPEIEKNEDGTGDDVSEGVDYCPWLTQSVVLFTQPQPPVSSPAEWHVHDGDSIQSVIDDCGFEPGDIIIAHPGTYTGNLNISKSLTIYSTDGADDTTIVGTVTIDLDNAETVVFGGTGAGFEVNSTSPGFDVDLEFWSHLTIQGSIITGNTDDGINVDSVKYWSSLSILDNEISDNGSYGIDIYEIRYFSQVDIEGNTIGGVGNGANGIKVQNVEDKACLNIVDNQITNNTARGIYVNEYEEGSDGVIRGNTISGNTDGIYISSGAEHGSSLAIIDNEVTGNTEDGMYLNDYEEGGELLVQDNRVLNNGDDGIYMYDVEDRTQATIQGNTISGNGRYGFYCDDMEDNGYLAILNNQITNNPRDGVHIWYLEEGFDCLIQGNTITGNGEFGIHLRSGVEEGSYLTIVDNTISGTQSKTITGGYIDTGDGSNRDFSLSSPVVPGSETIYLDGTPTTAYIIVYSTGQVVFDTAPLNGVVITADYDYRGLGIFIDDGVEDGGYSTFANNQITNNAHDGIYIDEIDEGSDVTIGGQGNTIAGNGGCGIEVGYKYYYAWDEEWYYYGVFDGAYLAILDNEIADNDYDGINIVEIEEGGEALIQGNNAISGNKDGIYIDMFDDAGKVTVDSNLISANTGVGLCLGGYADTLADSMAIVSANTISNNADWGIYFYVVHSVVDVSCCNKILSNGGGGIYIDGSELYFVGINQNNIEGNTGFGLRNDSGEMINAEDNWWGDGSGPGGVGPGTGDAVSNNVDYTPWSGWACRAPPGADFTADPREGEAPLTVPFTDLSSGDIDTWLWYFGDGQSSREQNPTHIYSQPGIYTVSLTVTGPYGTDQEMKVDYIEVYTLVVPASLIVCNLEISPTEVYSNELVTISADVVNQGGIRGSMRVDLVINGQVEQTTRAGVEPGTAKHITFTVSKLAPGKYEVFVEGQSGSFTVLLRPQASTAAETGGGLDTNGIIVIAVIGIILVVGVIVVFVFTRRRA